MSHAPQEQSVIAPSDAWTGGEQHENRHVRTEISIADPNAGHGGDEAASKQKAVGEYPGPENVENDGSALPVCYCGTPCTRLMSRSARNPNRWFFKCSKFKDDPTQCKYFKWEDEVESTSPQQPSAIRRRYDTNFTAGGGGDPPPRSHPQPPTGSVPPPPLSFSFGAPPGGGASMHTAPHVGQWKPYANDNDGTTVLDNNDAKSGEYQPTQQRDRSDDQCFQCGGKGHWSSECPLKNTAAPLPGGYDNNNTTNTNAMRGGSCYKCGQEGHWSRDCPNNTNSNANPGVGGYVASAAPGVGGVAPLGGYSGGGGGGGGSQGARSNARTCFKCGQEGHWARDCQNANSGGGGASGYGATNKTTTGNAKYGSCYKCGQEGHWARDCPSAGHGEGVAPVGGYNGYSGGGGGGGGVSLVGSKRRYSGNGGW